MPTNEPSEKNTEQNSQSNEKQELLDRIRETMYEAEETRLAIFNRDLKNPPPI